VEASREAARQPFPRYADIREQRYQDSDTDEVAEAILRADAAMNAALERTHPRPPAIAESLYLKARSHQDQLTPEERRLLLSRGDLLGKALAQPDSLTTEEIYRVLLMPPPDVVRANIQHATSGRLSTVEELFAKARKALDRGQFEILLNDDEIELLVFGFHTHQDFSANIEGREEALNAPGSAAAMSLLFSRLGWEGHVLVAALGFRCTPPPLQPRLPIDPTATCDARPSLAF
jgi:hypothetical protein